MEQQLTRHNKNYTRKEKRIIRDGYRDNIPPKEIAKMLGRDSLAIQRKASTLGVTKKRNNKKASCKVPTPPASKKVGLIRRFINFIY